MLHSEKGNLFSRQSIPSKKIVAGPSLSKVNSIYMSSKKKSFVTVTINVLEPSIFKRFFVNRLERFLLAFFFFFFFIYYFILVETAVLHTASQLHILISSWNYFSTWSILVQKLKVNLKKILNTIFHILSCIIQIELINAR